MKPEIAEAMRDVIWEYENPDSPEGLAIAMDRMKTIYCQTVAKKTLVGWKCGKCGKYFRRYGIESSQHQMNCQPEIYKP
jgi:hypothetical protein